MIKKNIATNELGFVFNPSTGDSFTSNPIAAQILQWMREQHDIAEIKKRLLMHYEVASSVAEKDLDDFIASLKEFNLLT